MYMTEALDMIFWLIHLQTHPHPPTTANKPFKTLLFDKEININPTKPNS